MKRFRLIAALLVTTAGCASMPGSRTAPGTADLTVGVASVDITPDEPIRLTGYGSRTTPTGTVGQRLSAKALAIGAGGGPSSVLITADVIGLPRHLTDEVARRLRPSGIDRARLVLSATHTHTGPSLSGMLPYIFSSPITADEQAAIDRYTQRLTGSLERVARAALADRRPARVSWGRGSAKFAAHRRVIKGGRWSAFGVDPDGPVDHDLPILAIHAPDGGLRAVLIGYACHATTLEGGDNFIHGDWPGTVAAVVQQRHPGATALVAIGAGADANPNPRGHGVADVQRHAEEIAAEVDRVIESGLRPVSAAPAGRFSDLTLAFSRVPERREWQEQASRKDPAGFYAADVLRRLDRGERVSPTTPYPVHVWTFGRDLAMVFLAGEVVSEYGLRLKRELDGTRVWVTAYSNDVPFYVASRRMIPEGGYEVDRSMVYYGQPAPLADDTEDRIIRGVRALIPSAFNKPDDTRTR